MDIDINIDIDIYILVLIQGLDTLYVTFFFSILVQSVLYCTVDYKCLILGHVHGGKSSSWPLLYAVEPDSVCVCVCVYLLNCT